MTDEKPKARRGCLFYGFFTGSLLLVLLLIAGLVLLRYAKKMVSDFTDTQPLPLPKVQIAQPELDALQRRIDTFRDAVRQGQPTGTLTLTADEINALIASDPDLQPLKGKFYVMIEGDQLKGQVSLPLDQIGLPVFKGRYLNGTGTFELAFRNGLIRLTAQSFVVKGKPLPEVYMEKIRRQNLARDVNSQPRAQAAMEKLKDIKVKDGKLVIVPK